MSRLSAYDSAPPSMKEIAAQKDALSRKREQRQKAGMRKTFVNIAKGLIEKKTEKEESRSRKEAIAGHARIGVKLAFAGVLALGVSAAALGFWRSGMAAPEIARVTQAHPEDAKKALALTKGALDSFKSNPKEFERICSHIDKMGLADIKALLPAMGTPVYEKAKVESPKFDGGSFYVRVPLEDGGVLYMTARYVNGAMWLINISRN